MTNFQGNNFQRGNYRGGWRGNGRENDWFGRQRNFDRSHDDRNRFDRSKEYRKETNKLKSVIASKTSAAKEPAATRKESASSKPKRPDAEVEKDIVAVDKELVKMKEKLGVSNKFRRFQDMERKIKYANGVLEAEDESTDEEPVHDPTAERDG